MGQLGGMFPGRKLHQDDEDGQQTGQGFEPGPIDLDSGVVYLQPPDNTNPGDTTSSD